MDEKHNTIKKMSNQRGFTLVELIVVIAIIGILTAIGSNYYAALKLKSADSQAYVEGRNLMTAVNDAFLSLEDVKFGDGSDIAGNVGDETSGGGPRPPVYTLSPGIRARIDGQSTTAPGGGYFIAFIYNVAGTEDLAASSGKKEYYYFIDEDSGTMITPDF